jgi:hypothetical protein
MVSDPAGGEIDLDHCRSGQGRAIEPRIEAGGNIDNHIHAPLTLFGDELVRHVLARHPSPSGAVAEGNEVGDLIAALSGETARKRIAKSASWRSVSCAVDPGQECGVRDIADQRLGLGREISSRES